MVQKLVRRLAILTITLAVLDVLALAQDQTAVSSSPARSGPSNNRSAESLLSTLPEADTLIYINPQRILNEAAPKLMSAPDLAKMRQQFNDWKQFAGVDPARIDFVVVGIRFRKPTAELNFSPPEFLVVTSGDFSADSLMTMASLALPEKLSEEQYGSKKLALITIDEISRQAEKLPILKSFSQLGLAALSTNTIAAGNVDYLKAAVDAAEGRDRIRPETLSTLLRDGKVLVSLVGSPRTSFAKSFGLRGTEGNPRVSSCESKLGDFYAAVTMEETTFKLRGAMNADNPDTAKIINNLLSSLLRSTTTAAGEGKSSAQNVLKTLNLTAQDNEVRLEADIPQQMVADFIREQTKPKPAATTKKPTGKAVRKRKTKR